MQIEFKTISKTNPNITLSGYIDLTTDNIDDPENIQYYNEDGTPNGYRIPKNKHNPESKEYITLENLKEAIATDPLFIQILWDYKDETHTLDRGHYILNINPE